MDRGHGTQEEKAAFVKILHKGRPQILGAIGVSLVLFYIALGVISYDLTSIFTYTIHYWTFVYGIPFYIVTGSLSIAVGRKRKPTISLVRAFLAMNIISSMVSIILLGVLSYDMYWIAYSEYNVNRLQNILIFMIIANVLQFCASVTLSNFGRLSLAARSSRQRTSQVPMVPTQDNNLILTSRSTPVVGITNSNFWQEDNRKPQDYKFAQVSTVLPGLQTAPTSTQDNQSDRQEQSRMKRWGNEGQGEGYSQQQWNPYPAGPAANNPYSSQQNPPPSTQPAEEVDMSEFRKVLLKGEPKVLGAVQLLIAFIGIMLGSIMLRLDNNSERYTYTSAYGFNFWSVPFFIISGSLSVSVEVKQNPTRMFVKSFMAMNTVSAIEALGSAIIYCYDIYRSEYFRATFLTVVLVFAVISNLLEFCIAVSLSHFGKLAKDAMTVKQSSAQVYSIPAQYSNPMTSAPDPIQTFGGPSPQFQPQNYNQPREADYRFPTAQSGLQRTPTFSQQNYQGANDNRMLNRYNMYN
ncbi:uncharacterized protein LOC143930421 isoform X2 [Lithobates pipiens]